MCYYVDVVNYKDVIKIYTQLLLTSYGAIADIVALAFVVLFALWGLVKGFTKVFFSMFGTIVGLLLAVLLAPSVTKFLQEQYSFVDTVAGGINGFVANIVGEDMMTATLSEAIKAQELGKTNWMINIALSLFSGSLPLETPINQILSPTLAYYVVNIISIIGLYLIFKLIFLVISKVVKSFYKFKFIERFDRGFGLLIGAVSGIVNLELLIMIIKIIPIALFQDIYAGIQASTIASFFETINLYGVLTNALSSVDVVSYVKAVVGIA